MDKKDDGYGDKEDQQNAPTNEANHKRLLKKFLGVTAIIATSLLKLNGQKETITP